MIYHKELFSYKHDIVQPIKKKTKKSDIQIKQWHKIYENLILSQQ